MAPKGFGAGPGGLHARRGVSSIPEVAPIYKLFVASSSRMEKLMVEAVTAEKIDAYDLGYIAGSRLETEDGVHIYYERYGIESPTTIVLIPNLFLIAPLWRNFSAELATKYS